MSEPDPAWGDAGTHGRLSVIIARIAAVALVAAGVLSVADPNSGASTAGTATASAPQRDDGCAPDRPAVAHRPGGEVLARQPTPAPVPCGDRTGWAGAETRIGVTEAGTVIYAPVVLVPEGANQHYRTPASLATSGDDGATWQETRPLGMTWQGNEHQLHVDRTTGRIFWYDPNANPSMQTTPGALPPEDQIAGSQAHLFWSGDEGATWTHSTACCPAFSENPRFATAPPIDSRPAGYPNVVYFCANSAVGVTSPLVPARICSRSLDGGTTWEQRSVLFSAGVPQHAECGANGEEFSAGDGNYPQGAPDGSLFVLVACGEEVFLARSTDEGATWPVIVDSAGAPVDVPRCHTSANAFVGAELAETYGELRVDEAGNLYLVCLEDERLLLWTSRDAGTSWAGPTDITAPAVSRVLSWFIAVREPGHLVASYYARTADETTFDGYLTATRDALGSRPLLWSARVNDPSTPMLTSEQGSRPPGPGYLDYNGADIGPDGTAWGSFVQDCGESPDDASCEVDGATIAAHGFVGRLLWPAGAATTRPTAVRDATPSGAPDLPTTGYGIGVGLGLIALSLVARALTR